MAQRIDGELVFGANTRRMERDILSSLRRVEKKAKLNLGVGGGLDKSLPLGRFPRISREVGEFEKSLEASNARVVAFGASVAVIAGVQKAFRSLTSEFVKTQAALIDIQTILNQTPKGLQEFSNSLFDVAKKTGQTFETVANGAKELARQGLSAEQTLSRLESALILNRLAGIEVEKAVSTLTATINGFSQSVLSSSQIVNKLATVEASFAVSAADLAEAITRSASSAADANVSFDQFISLITAAQQITARGGSVIGNGLKTIFTRVQRPQVIEQLREFNIEVGNASDGIGILQAVAKEINNLTNEQQSQVSELIGSVFQINVLKAILGDLNSEYSIYENALRTSNQATDEATKRNEQLNKTLTALANEVNVSFTQLSSTIGGLTVQPFGEFVLGEFNEILVFLNRLIETSEVAKGVLRGIGNALTGPGLIVAAKIILNLFSQSLGFAGGALATLTGIGGETKKIQNAQAVLNSLKATANQQDLEALRNATTRAQQEQIINRILIDRLALQRQVNVAGASMIGAIPRGINVNPNTGKLAGRGTGRVIPTGAGGILPAIMREQEAINKGVGGASSTASPKVIPNFSFGKGKRGPAVVNTDEYIVKNFQGSGGDAIFNKQMIGSMGMPSGAKKINKAEGHLPNGGQYSYSLRKGTAYINSVNAPRTGGVGTMPIKGTNTVGLMIEMLKRRGVSKISGVPITKGSTQAFSKILGKPLVRGKRFTANIAQGLIPNLANGQVSSRPIRPSELRALIQKVKSGSPLTVRQAAKLNERIAIDGGLANAVKKGVITRSDFQTIQSVGGVGNIPTVPIAAPKPALGSSAQPTTQPSASPITSVSDLQKRYGSVLRPKPDYSRAFNEQIERKRQLDLSRSSSLALPEPPEMRMARESKEFAARIRREFERGSTGTASKTEFSSPTRPLTGTQSNPRLREIKRAIETENRLARITQEAEAGKGITPKNIKFLTDLETKKEFNNLSKSLKRSDRSDPKIMAVVERQAKKVAEENVKNILVAAKKSQEMFQERVSADQEAAFQEGLKKSRARVQSIPESKFRSLFLGNRRREREIFRAFASSGAETPAQRRESSLAARDIIRSERAALTGRRQGAAIGGSIGFSILGGIASQAAQGKEGTTAGIGLGGAGGAAQGAAIGLSIGALFPPIMKFAVPAGAAIGLLAGALGKLEKNAQQLSQEFQKVSGEFQNNINAANQYIQTQVKLDSIVQSGSFSQADINSLIGELGTILSGIGDQKLKSDIAAAAGNIDELKRAFSGFQQREQGNVARAIIPATLKGLRESGDIKTISGIEEAARAINTAGNFLEIQFDETGKVIQTGKERLDKFNEALRNSDNLSGDLSQVENVLKALGLEGKGLADTLKSAKKQPEIFSLILRQASEEAEKAVRNFQDAQQRFNLTAQRARVSGELQTIQSFRDLDLGRTIDSRNIIDQFNLAREELRISELQSGPSGGAGTNQMILELERRRQDKKLEKALAEEDRDTRNKIASILKSSPLKEESSLVELERAIQSGQKDTETALKELVALTSNDFAQNGPNAIEQLRLLNEQLKINKENVKLQRDANVALFNIENAQRNLEKRRTELVNTFGGDILRATANVEDNTFSDVLRFFSEKSQIEDRLSRGVDPETRRISEERLSTIDKQISGRLKTLIERFGETAVTAIFGPDVQEKIARSEESARTLRGRQEAFAGIEAVLDDAKVRGVPFVENLQSGIQEIMGRRGLSSSEKIKELSRFITEFESNIPKMPDGSNVERANKELIKLLKFFSLLDASAISSRYGNSLSALAGTVMQTQDPEFMMRSGADPLKINEIIDSMINNPAFSKIEKDMGLSLDEAGKRSLAIKGMIDLLNDFPLNQSKNRGFGELRLVLEELFVTASSGVNPTQSLSNTITNLKRSLILAEGGVFTDKSERAALESAEKKANEIPSELKPLDSLLKLIETYSLKVDEEIRNTELLNGAREASAEVARKVMEAESELAKLRVRQAEAFKAMGEIRLSFDERIRLRQKTGSDPSAGLISDNLEKLTAREVLKGGPVNEILNRVESSPTYLKELERKGLTVSQGREQDVAMQAVLKALEDAGAKLPQNLGQLQELGQSVSQLKEAADQLRIASIEFQTRINTPVEGQESKAEVNAELVVRILGGEAFGQKLEDSIRSILQEIMTEQANKISNEKNGIPIPPPRIR